ncbi:MAG: holin family protein [Pseudomonadota bacterium]
MDITGLGSIADLAKGIMDKIWPPGADPNKRMEAELELQKIMEARENSVIEAQKSIIVAELQQADNYTKRARPTIVYAGLGFIFMIHVFFPLFAFFSDKAIPEGLTLPAEFWWAWTGAVGIWMVGRTMEKRGSNGKTLSMITGK